jgi:hypothetical protein
MPGPDPAAPAARSVTDPDLHLVVAGRRIEPERRGLLFVFPLRLPCGDVRLVSRRAQPDALGLADDGRQLGVHLWRLDVVREGAAEAVPLDHPALGEGMHAVEADGLRWTDGDARLPGFLLGEAAGTAELHVAAGGLPRYLAAEAPDAALFARFASLGDDCELGLVQREFGAEPMDLLRWAGTDIARLMLGLCRGFEGLGDPARTALEYRDDEGEYRLRAPPYFGQHTWVYGRLADAAAEEMRLAAAARLRLLRRKLLADIAAGQRIMVFASSRHDLARPALEALHAALRALGPAPLLCVVRAPAPGLVGQVERLGGGLYLGCIDQLTTVPEGISYASWRRLCRAAAALVDEDMAEQGKGEA